MKKESEKDDDPLVPSYQPLPRTGCCPCCSPRCLVLLVGIFSVLMSMVVLLPSLYMLVRKEAWKVVRDACHTWLEQNHWDIKVTQVVWRGVRWVDLHHRMLLASLIGCTVVHLFFCLMLVLGGILYNRSLFLPWLVSKMTIIIIMVITFICWTFMSFFVDLLMAIVFPVVGGLVLGFNIHLWKRVRSVFVQLGQRQVRRAQAGYKQVPLRKVEDGEDPAGRGFRRPHRQLLVVAESSNSLRV